MLPIPVGAKGSYTLRVTPGHLANQFKDAALNTVTVAPLRDGRLQLWGIDTNDRLWTTWKKTTSPTASWTHWSEFFTP